MSARDLEIIKSPGDVRTYQRDDRTTSGESATAKPGEPMLRLAEGSPYVVLPENTTDDGAPQQGSDEFVGINITVPSVLQNIFRRLGDSFRKWGRSMVSSPAQS